ncbi:MAG: tetratricopeptide repeat protein [Deltaproteobacteria bacterium]|nr:tetratricopeptide repeat protein [Deltaproteobacteria bacterium]
MSSLKRNIPNKSDIEAALNLIKYAEHNAAFSSEPLVEAALNRSDDEKSALDYLLISTDYWKNGEYEKSLRNAYTGVALNSSDTRVKASLELRLGTVFQDLGSEDRSWELAEKCFNEAIEIDKSFPLSYVFAGDLQFDLGEYDDAEELYQKARQMDVNDPATYNSLGYLYLEQERNKEAEEAFRAAEKLEPELPIVHLHLATLFQEQGRNDEAVEEFEKAIAMYPENALWYCHLSMLLLELKQFDKAEDVIKKAKKISPKNETVLSVVKEIKKLKKLK